jgi:hypothetical protein
MVSKDTEFGFNAVGRQIGRERTWIEEYTAGFLNNFKHEVAIDSIGKERNAAYYQLGNL